MLSSISGHNDRWAQVAASQPPSPASSGQTGGSGSTSTATAVADPSVVSPIAGGTGDPLSGSMSFMLMMLDKGTPSGTGTASGGRGAPSSLPDGASSAAPTTGVQGDTPAGAPALPKDASTKTLLAALETMMPTLRPRNSSPGGGSTKGPGDSPSELGTNGSHVGSRLQSLDDIGSDLGTIAVASGALRPLPPPPVHATPDGHAAGSDTGTGSAASAPTWQGGWDNTSNAGDGWRQQVGVAVYSSGELLSPNRTKGPPAQSITA